MSKHTHRKPLPIAELRAFLNTHRQDGGNLVLRTRLAKLLDALSNVYALLGCNPETDEQAAFAAVVSDLRRLADRLRATKRGAYAESRRALLHRSARLDRALRLCKSTAYALPHEALAHLRCSDLASFEPTETLCG